MLKLMNNSQDNNQTYDSSQYQASDSSMQSTESSSDPSSINLGSVKQSSKLKLAILVAILILVLGLGLTGYILTRGDAAHTINDIPASSKQGRDIKSLSEIITTIRVEISKINMNLKEEEINTAISNTKIIGYRNKTDIFPVL
jgi:uncharacterized protein HemX